MSSLLSQTSSPEHPPRVDLLLYADGELATQEAAQLEQHLKACWHCRAQVARIEETIGDIIAFDDKVLTSLTPSGGWPSLNARLREISAAPLKPFWAGRWRKWFAPAHFLTPRTAGWALASVVLAGLAALVLVQSKWPATVSAAELLENAQTAQNTELKAQPQPVAYQKLRVRRNGKPLAQWEIWRDTTARRARQTTTPDAVPATEAGHAMLELARIMRHNQMNPQEPLSAAMHHSWRVFLPEKQDTLTATQTPEGATVYLLKTAAPVYASQITSATLFVRARDWRVTGLHLTAVTDAGATTYEIDETESAVKNAPELAPDFFAAKKIAKRPDTITATEGADEPPVAAPDSNESAPPPAKEAQPLTAQEATSELELDLISRLDQVNAFLGEQLEVTRGRGVLVVQGVVADEARKREILQALNEFRGNPAVRLALQTVAEAQARQGKRSGPKAVEDVSAKDNEIPLAGDARESLERQGLKDEAQEKELNALAARLLRRSAQLRSQALALRQIAARFTPEQLAKMDETVRARWRGLVKRHARNAQGEAAALRQEIGGIVTPQSGAEEGPTVNSDGDVIRAAQRLYELATATDAAARRSFSVTAKGGSAASVKSAAFWRALNGAESLAGKIGENR
jgi:anti-sigma factor RsiW